MENISSYELLDFIFLCLVDFGVLLCELVILGGYKDDGGSDAIVLAAEILPSAAFCGVSFFAGLSSKVFLALRLVREQNPIVDMSQYNSIQRGRVSRSMRDKQLRRLVLLKFTDSLQFALGDAPFFLVCLMSGLESTSPVMVPVLLVAGFHLSSVKPLWLYRRELKRVQWEMEALTKFVSDTKKAAKALRDKWESDSVKIKPLSQTHGIQWDSETKPFRERMHELSKQIREMREVLKIKGCETDETNSSKESNQGVDSPPSSTRLMRLQTGCGSHQLYAGH